MATNAALAYKELEALTRLETVISALSERFGVEFTPALYNRETRYYEAEKLESYADFLEKLDAATPPPIEDELAPEVLDKLIVTAYDKYFPADTDAAIEFDETEAFRSGVLFVLAGGEENDPDDSAPRSEDAPQSDETAPPSDESGDEAPEDGLDLSAPADANNDGVIDEAEAKKEAEREKRRARDAARKAAAANGNTTKTS